MPGICNSAYPASALIGNISHSWTFAQRFGWCVERGGGNGEGSGRRRAYFYVQARATGALLTPGSMQHCVLWHEYAYERWL